MSINDLPRRLVQPLGPWYENPRHWLTPEERKARDIRKREAYNLKRRIKRAARTKR